MSTNKSTNGHILSLNDDCFYEIYKNLPIMDWCSLRETCTRLQSFSDHYFIRHNNKFDLEVRRIYGISYNAWAPELLMKDFKRIMRNFGKCITKLTVNRNSLDLDEDHSQIVPLLDRYCNALEDLKLVKIDFYRSQIDKCEGLFSKLHRLVLDKTCVDEKTFTGCLTLCRSIKELELIRLYNIRGCVLDNHFTSLESFSVKSCKDFGYKNMQRFFILNPQLTSLKLIGCDFLADQLVPDIAEHLPNLERFSLRLQLGQPQAGITQSIVPLAKIKRLEIDTIGFGFFDLNPLLMAMATHKIMEHLIIGSVDVARWIDALCGVKTLKILKFTLSSGFSADICKKLATELPLLSEIHLVECMNVTFNEIKEFAEHSASLKRIVVNRDDDEIPSLTKDTFLLLLQAKQQRQNDETLFVHLDDDDLNHIKSQLEYDGHGELLSEHDRNIKLLPLKADDLSTYFDYGFNGRKHFVPQPVPFELGIIDDDFDYGLDDYGFDRFNDPYYDDDDDGDVDEFMFGPAN